MKVIKVIGLLAAIVVVSNLQSMEAPTNYPLEKAWAMGDISTDDYVLRLEELGDVYADMLAALGAAEYINVGNMYKKLIKMIQAHQQILLDAKPHITETLLQKLRNATRQKINAYYRDLLAAIANGDAREGMPS